MIIFPAEDEMPAEVFERRAADDSDARWMDNLIIVGWKLELLDTEGGFGGTVTPVAGADKRACFQRSEGCSWFPDGGRMTALKEMLEIWTVSIEMNVRKVDGKGNEAQASGRWKTTKVDLNRFNSYLDLRWDIKTYRRNLRYDVLRQTNA